MARRGVRHTNSPSLRVPREEHRNEAGTYGEDDLEIERLFYQCWIDFCCW